MSFTPSYALRRQATPRVVAKAKGKTAPHAALLRQARAAASADRSHTAASAPSLSPESRQRSEEAKVPMTRIAKALQPGPKKTLWQSYSSLSLFTRYMISLSIGVVGLAGMFLSDYLEVLYPTEGAGADATSMSRPARLLGIRVVDRAEADGKTKHLSATTA